MSHQISPQLIERIFRTLRNSPGERAEERGPAATASSQRGPVSTGPTRDSGEGASPSYGSTPQIYTQVQIRRLETMFQTHRYVNSDQCRSLCRELNLNESQVQMWFRNRRANVRQFWQITRAILRQAPGDVHCPVWFILVHRVSVRHGISVRRLVMIVNVVQMPEGNDDLPLDLSTRRRS